MLCGQELAAIRASGTYSGKGPARSPETATSEWPIYQSSSSEEDDSDDQQQERVSGECRSILYLPARMLSDLRTWAFSGGDDWYLQHPLAHPQADRTSRLRV